MCFRQTPGFFLAGDAVIENVSMSMAALPPNVMARIAELADTKDLQNLRLVSKEWCDAVGYAQVRVRPRTDLARAQLPVLCSTFWRATALDMSGCRLLEDAACLVALHSLSQSLTELDVSKKDWLSDRGVALLVPLIHLEILDLSDSKALSGLPDSIGMLTALRVLHLRCCPLLRVSLPGMQLLPGLKELNLSGCINSVILPDAISGLTALNVLVLEGCKSLLTLPESISCLAFLQRLNMSGCERLLFLPESMSELHYLQVCAKLDF